MAMSWGWTPLCRVGSERYRISGTADRPPPPSVVISSTQCGYGLSQLPPETSVVLSAPRQGTVSSQLPMLSPVRSQISPDYSSQPAAENQSTTSSAEERVVRRSPRLARSNRVSYREDGETQANRTRSPWNNPSQQDRTMWNSDRGQSNCSQQSNKSYSVYNYDGQTHPLINTSVSIVYNHHNKNLINNVATSRVPLTLPFTAAKTSVPTNSIRSANKKVTIKNLDFYDVVTSLLQEEVIHDGIGPLQRTFRFFLNNDDVNHIQDKKRKHPYLVQLRFCKLDGSCEQSDYYPVTHQVAVNHQIVLLPGLETMPRGAMRPMDITHFCQVNVQSCNFLTIRCLESCKLFLSIVQKYTSQDLLCRLEEKSPTKEEDTTNEIKKKLEGDQADDGIASTTLQCSLLCPLSRTRMKLPCRASTCNHLQCFDAATYLQLNECKPKWSCPVCYQPALYKNLQIDGYFKKILDENTTADKVELQPDGSWTLAEATTKKKPQVANPVSEERSEDRKSVDPGDKTVVLDSDDDDTTANNSSKQDNQGNKNVSTVTPSRQNNSPEIETIVLSDDDSPDAERPSVTATPYPTYCPTPIERAHNAGNNDVSLESEQLTNMNSIWGRDVISLFRNNCLQLDPFQHSNSSLNSSLYIPLSRTSISPPQFNSNSITITRATNQPNSNSSDRLSRNPEGNQSTQEKEKSSTQRVSKSKITKSRKKVHKNSKTTNKGNKQTKRKRRRIIVESSESSDSNLDSSKKTSSVSIHKHSAKQKHKKRKRQISESSEGDKSSIYSSTSNNSDSSVNLISSSNSSRSSSSSSSSSSDSSDNEESEHSDNSFIAAYRHVSSTQISKNYLNGTQQTKCKERGLAARSHQPLPSQEQSMTDVAICPEKGVELPESSRVLRSTAQKQKRKKK